MAETTPTQRLHLVMGGRVKDPRGIEFQDPETKSKSHGSVKVEDVVGKSKALSVGDKLNCDIEKQVSSCWDKTSI